MATSPELTRQTKHILLDALSAFDDTTNPNPEEAIRTALDRLSDIDAVTSTYDDQTGMRAVDLQPVLHASLGLLTTLITMVLIDHPKATGLDIVQALRDGADEVAQS